MPFCRSDEAPQPDPTWPEDVRRLYEHDMVEMWDRALAPHVWNMYHSQLRLYGAFAARWQPKAILDVGCAQGTLALILAEQGYDVWAVDVRPQFLEYARSRYEHGEVEFICGDALTADLGRTFDLVFANQIIEHMVEPVLLLKRLHALTDPGGHVVLTTPNHGYVKNALPSYGELGDPTRYMSHHGSADGEDHFYALTAPELRRLLLGAGFRQVHVTHFHTPWMTGHCKVRYLHRLIPAAILEFLEAVTRWLPLLGPRLCYQLCAIAEA